MTLLQAMAALAKNEGMVITIKANSGAKLITYNAEGYEQIEATLAAKTVDEIHVVDATTVYIIMAE